MTLAERLQSVRRLFLDTAPVIYYVEENARYLPLVETVFDRLDTNVLAAVTSPVTLAECLVAPYRSDQAELRQVFADVIVSGSNTEFVPIDRTIADKAGELWARHNLTLTDALTGRYCLERRLRRLPDQRHLAQAHHRHRDPRS